MKHISDPLQFLIECPDWKPGQNIRSEEMNAYVA